MPYETPHGDHLPDARAARPGVPLGIPKERVAALLDGIVAITATLLTLNISVPGPGETLTLSWLMETAKPVLHWVISFVMVAVIWAELRFVFAHSQRWDGGLLAVTFVQMGLISLIPFASDLVGSFPSSFLAATVFASIMGANGLLVSANFVVLRRKQHLHSADHSMTVLARRARAQLLVYPGCLVVSLVAAWLHDPLLGILAWAICPVALAYQLQRGATRAASAKETPNEGIA